MNLTITDVRLTPILVADPPLLNTQGVHQPYTPRLIVEVETADGVVGVGETYGDTKYLELARPFAERLRGRQVSDLNGLFTVADEVAVDAARVSGQVDVGGLRGVQTADKLRLSVVSGFEVACLDALGKALGLPVHTLLGGKVRDSVEYSAYLFYKWAAHPAGVPAEADDWGAALDPAGVVAQARRFKDRYGFTSFKLKGGVFPPEEEIAAVRALAEAFPGHPLRLDPNGAWSVETSLKVAKELGDVLEYLEDPALGTPAMAEVAAGTDVPLATNMCVTTFGEIREAFTRGAVQVVLSDHHYWGGLRNTRELAAVCRTFGVGVSMHSNTHLGISLAAMTHVAATVPDLHHACDSHYPGSPRTSSPNGSPSTPAGSPSPTSPASASNSTTSGYDGCTGAGSTTTGRSATATTRPRCGWPSRGGRHRRYRAGSGAGRDARSGGRTAGAAASA